MKSKLYISSVACLGIFTLASCGGGDGGLSSSSPSATSASAASTTPFAAAMDKVGNNLGPTPITATVPGWPNYLAMGSVGGPNTFPPINPPVPGAGGILNQDDFGGTPIDAVFKYGGINGNGDPGVIDPPTLALMMSSDLNGSLSLFTSYGTKAIPGISYQNGKVARPVLVEYTSQMSGGLNLSDFTDTSSPTGWDNKTYLMSRHFSSLMGDVMALYANPITLNSQNYYGSIIMNPDLFGFIQQNNYIGVVNDALPAGRVNLAVDRALCLMTPTNRTYTNTFNPNALSPPFPPYLTSPTNSFSGSVVGILTQMLKANYPVYSINSTSGLEPFWNAATNNLINGGTPTVVGAWFTACTANPTYDKTQYDRPNFPAGFDGWIQAQNWIIRTFAPPINGQNTVTFGWHDNMSAVNTGWWVHNDYPTSAGATIPSVYSTPVSQWLCANAPSAIWTSSNSSVTGNCPTGLYKPDFFVFDRYEHDDSMVPDDSQATLYNARDWDNYLTAVGQVSKNFSNIPVMIWQIPGSGLPIQGYAEIWPGGTPSPSYVFSSAPAYFFGDTNTNASLSNIIIGTPPGIQSLTSSGLTATVTTTAPHQLTNNSSALIAQAVPLAYNGSVNSINVTGSNTFTYTLAASPGSSATSMGIYAGNKEPLASIYAGAYPMPCTGASLSYNCKVGTTYQQYLLTYPGGNYNWSQNNGKLALAASNNVFAIMWGGGNTTNVIYNLQDQPASDGGKLKQMLINYYQWTPPGNLTPTTK